MNSEANLPATQRAYALRLTSHDPNWRDRVWRTHLAVNRGAAAFGDWLLTLRGGLEHGLADESRLDPKAVDKALKDRRKARQPNEPEPTRAEVVAAMVRDRRILLALSWLSVEVGYNGPHAIGTDKDKVRATFLDVLRKRRLTEAEVREWETDCADSLQANIKEDALWVNRSLAFDAQVQRFGTVLNRDEAGALIAEFFGKADDYLAPVELGDEGETAARGDADGEQKFRTVARGWVSTNWGTDEKSDKEKIAQSLRRLAGVANDCVGQSGMAFVGRGIQALGGTSSNDAPVEDLLDELRKHVGWITGSPSIGRLAVEAAAAKTVLSAADVEVLREKIEKEADKKAAVGNRAAPGWCVSVQRVIEARAGLRFHVDRDHTGEFSTMLDHAARRVSTGHTWIKRAEAERRNFYFQAQRLQRVPPSARQRLDDFCAERSKDTAAKDAYRIRPRALAGWKEVVAKWAKGTGDTEEVREKLRIEAVGEVQREFEDDRDEKFGDHKLFEELAGDDALCVWREDGRPDGSPYPEWLLDYAAGSWANFKRADFKVPAYCHPDPLVHPVFCDFGNSRWEISFACHRAPTRAAKAELDVKRLRENRAKTESQLAKANEDAKRERKQAELDEWVRKLVEAEKKLAWLGSPHALTLGLLDGGKPVDAELRWQSKRLVKDLALDAKPGSPSAVTRADRLSRASGQAPVAPAPVSILDLFDKQKDWNGRLQAPREQLEKLAVALGRHAAPKAITRQEALDAYVKHADRLLAEISEREHSAAGKRIAHARSLHDHLEWLVTFSARLQPQGPWLGFVERSADKTPFQRTVRETKGTRRMGESFPSLEGWPHDELNKPLKLNEEGNKLVADSSAKRGNRALLILSRLPGLRLLSADLGHRYGAAGAVWETLSPEQFRQECDKARQAGATVNIQPLFAQFLWPKRQGNSSNKEFNPVTLFRRIGPDFWDDAQTKPHPAPWARLERQFLIKLQGEEADAREASNEEIWFVHQLEWACGMKGQAPPDKQKRRLDLPLIDRMVAAGFGQSEKWPKQKLRLEELRRLGWEPVVAPIANAQSSIAERMPSLAVDDLMSDAVDTLRLALRRHGTLACLARDLPATHKTVPGGKRVELPAEERPEFLAKLLLDWHGLITHRRAPDEKARALWESVNFLKPFLRDEKEGGLEVRPEDPEAAPTRKAREKRNLASLAKVVGKFAPGELPRLAGEFKRLWEEADGMAADVPKPGTKGPRQTQPTTKGTGFHFWLRELGDRLWPSGLRKDRRQTGEGKSAATDWAKVASGRNTGGLSPQRVTTLREFWDLQKAFAGRERWDGRKWIHPPAKEGFGKRKFDAVDELRDQRMKQLASHIAAAALGLAPDKPSETERRVGELLRQHRKAGAEAERKLLLARALELLKPVCLQSNRRLPKPDGTEAERLTWVQATLAWLSRQRLNKLVNRSGGEAPFSPCHAVVIENLDNYKLDQRRTRRENRLRATWKVSELKKFLAEACQLNGLHLREVNPKWTSQQDSRTGAAGVRCTDVPLRDFLREGGFWAREAERIRRKKERDDAETLLFDTFNHWSARQESPSEAEAKRLKHGSIRLLKKNGGELFVSAASASDQNSSGTRRVGQPALQADLNASANVGLKALLDPDWAGSWWYVPCDPKEFCPVAEAVNGCLVFERDGKAFKPLPTDEQPRADEPVGRAGKGNARAPYLWRDVSTAKPNEVWRRVRDRKEEVVKWAGRENYWSKVEKDVAAILRAHNDLPPEDDLPS
ncbi:MAG: type V CRISPR-associated protein Cas12b [Verrucomicrobia bacterium]|nr:type V CRISPR-associated protein Cas12b [Verrucomicrobiota bacterium]